MLNNTPTQYKNFSGIEDFFKSLDWVGVGIGALGVMAMVYFLITSERKR
jgi:hypothetical protein